MTRDWVTIITCLLTGVVVGIVFVVGPLHQRSVSGTIPTINCVKVKGVAHCNQ